VNTLVLSGTAPIVPSGTRSSCYREPKSGLSPTAKRKFGDSNFSNRKSNLVRERHGRRAPPTNPVIDLIFSQASSSQHFCKSDFTDDASLNASTLMLSALLAADPIVIPAQPTPFRRANVGREPAAAPGGAPIPPSRPSDPATRVRTPEPSASNDGAKADLFTARRTIDVKPELHGRITIPAFQRGITVAEMLRDLLSREFPDNAGDAG
jgi:hypothetical protein